MAGKSVAQWRARRDHAAHGRVKADRGGRPAGLATGVKPLVFVDRQGRWPICVGVIHRVRTGFRSMIVRINARMAIELR